MSTPFAPDWCALPSDFWFQIFGERRPIDVEIGPGLGEFLEAIATHHPDRSFFAIERAASRTRVVQQRIDRKGLTNVRVLCAEAECVLALWPDDCVDRFHIQFPDPWWKRRHHRRRLMNPAFVAELRRILRPGGSINLITDVEEYFALAQVALRGDSGLEEVPAELDDFTATSFSRKASVRGWRLSAAKHRKREQ